jgi:DNA polymerase III epsilon subunit-like protein
VIKKKVTKKVAPKRGAKKVITKKGPARKKVIAAPAIVSKPGFPIVVFDTETTGLTKNRTVRLDKQPEVIEFYARLVDLDAGPEPIRELYTLIRPSVEYPMSAYTIRETKTKIGNDELKDAPVFAEVADAIHDFLCEAKSPGNLAHNLSFDRDMIEIEMERLNRKIAWPLVGICTVEQTIHLRGRRMNQTALHQYLFEGKDFPGAHRARNDVEALTNIAVELHRRGVI